LTAPALALLALASGGCFLFGTKPPEPEPVAPVAEEPACKPPAADLGTPTATTIPPFEMWPNIVGTTVYSLVWDSKGGHQITVGEPLTVCSVQETGPDTARYATFVNVMTAAGVEFKTESFTISSTPPLFSMTAASKTKAEDLIKVLFTHAYQIQMSRYEIARKYNTVRLTDGDDTKVNWDYQLDRGYKAAGDIANRLLWGMYYGLYARESLLSQSSCAWIANAEDDKVVDWFAGDNKKNEADPNNAVYEDMVSCVQGLETVSNEAFSLGRLEEERAAKRWRDGMQASESKLAKMDEVEFKKIDDDKKRAIDNITKNYDSKECQKSREFVGLPAPAAPL
jgi:hypothetical protein